MDCLSRQVLSANKKLKTKLINKYIVDYLSANTHDAGIKPCTVYEIALTKILN